MNLNDVDKQYLIDLINNNEQIPEDYKYLLFPTIQEEYELTYAGKMRKEDILAGEDGTFPVPLQLERLFKSDNQFTKNQDWKNMIVFGDNLQFLKTINENKDPLIKDKVKGKVKLIYIDPPFATQDEFQTKEGAKAYSDKKKGAEFLEFLRRRLILAKEVLAPDGAIYVHLDQKMGHYVKVILDEVFGKNNIRNEIIWCYKTSLRSSTEKFGKDHDIIYFYANPGHKISPDRSDFPASESTLKRWAAYADENGFVSNANFAGSESTIIDTSDETKGFNINNGIPRDWWEISANVSKGNTSEVISGKYPTQKPEELLARIIKASSKKGDLVMDFFGGSGTTIAVAEKLGRRWIACDLGKLSYLTMQKRILLINEGKDLTDKTEKPRKYGKQAKAFITCKLGMYDLKQTLNLEWEKYKEFVSQLFEFEKTTQIISGVEFEGEKRGFPVKIFNYIKHKDSAVDALYIQNLHKSLGAKRFGRVYILAPATRIDFIADYEEIDETRYYFLKVPYEMIEELHKTPFTKSRQPRSRNNINSIEEMKGFQFIYTPDVECKLQTTKKKIKLVVSKFASDPLNGGLSDNFATLSSIFVNYDYNGKEFLMDEARFWSELESEKKTDKDTCVFYKNGKIDRIEWTLPENKIGKKTMFIFTDIYGNDATVCLTREKA
jgi:site-specific DNA-methyltransferase (adenine-specific)/adenine-specific DNA-methyltransferase